MEKPEQFEYVMWSSAKDRIIRALVSEYIVDADGLDVMLYREKNPVDPTAVAVVCNLFDDKDLNRKILGGESRMLDGKYVGQRIGYVTRNDPNKIALASDEFGLLPIPALLRFKERRPDEHVLKPGELFIQPIWPTVQSTLHDMDDPDFLPF